jgi:hypothetical protein
VTGWAKRLAAVAVLLVGLAPLTTSAASLSGTWESALTLTTPSMLDLEAAFSIDWDADGFSASCEANLDQEGLDGFELAASTSVGDLDLDFDAAFSSTPAQLDKAVLTIATAVEGVSLSCETTIEHGGSTSTVSFEGTLPWASWSAAVDLSLCPLAWKGVEIDVAELQFGCVEDLSVTLLFSPTGFKRLEIDLPDVDVPLPWNPFVSVSFSFTPTSKDVKFKTGFDWADDDSCISITLAAPSGVDAGYLGPGFAVKSIEIECSLEEIDFRFAHTTAWDLFEISGAGEECGKLTWDVKIYSKPAVPTLFSIESVTCSLRFQPCEALYTAIKLECKMTGTMTLEVTVGGSW